MFICQQKCACFNISVLGTIIMGFEVFRLTVFDFLYGFLEKLLFNMSSGPTLKSGTSSVKHRNMYQYTDDLSMIKN